MNCVFALCSSMLFSEGLTIYSSEKSRSRWAIENSHNIENNNKKMAHVSKAVNKNNDNNSEGDNNNNDDNNSEGVPLTMPDLEKENYSNNDGYTSEGRDNNDNDNNNDGDDNYGESKDNNENDNNENDNNDMDDYCTDEYVNPYLPKQAWDSVLLKSKMSSVPIGLTNSFCQALCQAMP